MAVNGCDALKKVQEWSINHYDVIILDINMPIMNGIEASNKIYDFLHDSTVSGLVSIKTQDKVR